jgi:F5/8 type C domain-containing protein
MRKRIINKDVRNVSASNQNWLDLQRLAQVEVTSEDAEYPVEAALISGGGSGWRASEAGEQTIRLLFDEPQRVRRIQLLFDENQQPRTQQFVLRWSSDGGQSYEEIVRQQYNFSPPETTREFEDYAVDLAGATVLELKIVPEIGGGDARGSLAQFRIA